MGLSFCLLTAFVIGLSMSVMKTFLFWHLKDLGGTQMLFSLIPAVNTCSDVFMYFYSATVISRYGHVKVLYMSLICYSIRLAFYGFLRRPWFVLAVEPLSGITTAASWAAMTSYVGVSSTPEVATTMQGLLHGVHWGLGHGIVELVSGYMVAALGASQTFICFSVLCLI